MGRAPMGRVATVHEPMRRVTTGRVAMPAAATVAWSGPTERRAARAATVPRRRVQGTLPSSAVLSAPAATEMESAAAVGAGVVAADAVTAARTPATDS
jgi:hypothetical protein